MKNKRMDHISKIMSKRHDDFTENFTTLSEEKKSAKNDEVFCRLFFLPTIAFYRRLTFTDEYFTDIFFTNENI